jgi:hypothetical protein
MKRDDLVRKLMNLPYTADIKVLVIDPFGCYSPQDPVITKFLTEETGPDGKLRKVTKIVLN